MSWLQKLYETYEQCATNPEFTQGENALMPICHTSQQAHIEIVIDEQGNFLRASVISKRDGATVVPCTEASGGRSGSKPVNHPLCDKLQYIAGDFEKFGGEVTSGFKKTPSEPHEAYLTSLEHWLNSPYKHPKLAAIHNYVKKGSVMQDLIEKQIIFVDDKNKILKKWNGDKKNTPPIFTLVPAGKGPEDAFIRWVVEEPGNLQPKTWEDYGLMEAWIGFYTARDTENKLCLITGEPTVLAEQHPAKLRNSADRAKLISANDTSGFTFRGRFLEAEQACGVSFDVTQKAHNALRWLIERQGYKNNKVDQAIVAWAIAGVPIPDPFKNSLDIFGFESDEQDTQTQQYEGDAGQSFAHRLKKCITGYQAKLGATEDIVVMGIDSATPGRMAITFYRELKGSEFLTRIEAWHSDFAWRQNYGWDSKAGKRIQFVGVPSPKDISEVAYGHRDDKGTVQLDDKMQKATVERLLPCIVDGLQIPRDLVESTVRRACNRISMKKNRHNGKTYEDDWEKTLGIACALYKGYYLRHTTKSRNYQMSLENRTSRDYLYGRLLAIADYLEHQALHAAGENRDTNAAKLMQRFADHPYSTWRSIELSLTPYKTRLRSKKPGLLVRLEKMLDEIHCLFDEEKFIEDSKLSGEFLLGFHSQRHALWNKPEEPEQNDTETTDNENN